ncbi:small integral membrane protein 29 isoform X1 [Odocoileus virginianus]|uniref:Small integral membrane protein 29 isoform X1 n=1 Tax=Odocoileus virginianus TaxID=9874 RepID=A0ABM4HAT8_ODOVR
MHIRAAPSSDQQGEGRARHAPALHASSGAQPPQGRPAGRREAARPSPRSPRLPPAAVAWALQPRLSPLPDWRLRQAGCLRPSDWLHPDTAAPPVSPGPLITRLLALPGPRSQTRAFLSGLQRREGRPVTLPTSECPLDHGTGVRLGESGAPLGTETGGSALNLRWKPRRTGVTDLGASACSHP